MSSSKTKYVGFGIVVTDEQLYGAFTKDPEANEIFMKFITKLKSKYNVDSMLEGHIPDGDCYEFYNTIPLAIAKCIGCSVEIFPNGSIDHKIYGENDTVWFIGWIGGMNQGETVNEITKKVKNWFPNISCDWHVVEQ